MHYTVERRQRFATWVDDGCPAVAVIKVNNEERQVSTALMLRSMRRCTDLLPSAIADQLGLENSLRGRSYGEAARRLLAAGATATP